MTFGGRRPLVEDNLLWKMTFCGRRLLVEDNIWLKMPFSGRRPSLEDGLCWKTTFGGRLPAVKDNLQWKTTFVGSLRAANSALRHFFCAGFLPKPIPASNIVSNICRVPQYNNPPHPTPTPSSGVWYGGGGHPPCWNKNFWQFLSSRDKTLPDCVAPRTDS